MAEPSTNHAGLLFNKKFILTNYHFNYSYSYYVKKYLPAWFRSLILMGLDGFYPSNPIKISDENHTVTNNNLVYKKISNQRLPTTSNININIKKYKSLDLSILSFLNFTANSILAAGAKEK